MIKKFKSFLLECSRVLKITKRPDKEEFQSIVKVSGLGILLIGFIGFLLVILKQVLTQGA